MPSVGSRSTGASTLRKRMQRQFNKFGKAKVLRAVTGLGKAVAKHAKKHTNLKTIQENLGQVTESKFSLVAGKPHKAAKLMKLLGSPQYYNNSNKNGTCSAAGPSLAVYSQEVLTAQSELFNINTFILSTAAIVPGAPTRYLLESVHFEREMQNQSSVPCTVDFYLIRSKRDTWASATTPMVFTNTANVGYPWPTGQPQEAIQVGYASQTNTAIASNAYLHPAIYPQQVDLFNQYFEIVKHEKIDMALGGIHKLNFSIRYDKVADGSVFGNSPLVGIKGFTYFILMRASGSVATDVTQGGIGVLAPATISYVDQRSYKFTQLWNPIIASSDNNFGAGAPGDTLSQVNPGSGTVVNVTTT